MPVDCDLGAAVVVHAEADAGERVAALRAGLQVQILLVLVRLDDVIAGRADDQLLPTSAAMYSNQSASLMPSLSAGSR